MSNNGDSNPNLLPAAAIKPASREVDGVRKKLADARGPKYWRTLEELSGQEEEAFGELLEREFPRAHSEWVDPVSRRDFLKLAGASMALAGLAGCTRQPVEQILPYVRQPEELVPGRPIFYATAMPFAGYALPLLVETHEYRPTKVEGNPKHACSLGEAWFRNHTAERLYPDALIDGKPATLDAAIEAAADYLYRADLPLVYGLSNVTCEAQREAVSLTELIGGVIDSHTSL